MYVPATVLLPLLLLLAGVDARARATFREDQPCVGSNSACIYFANLPCEVSPGTEFEVYVAVLSRSRIAVKLSAFETLRVQGPRDVPTELVSDVQIIDGSRQWQRVSFSLVLPNDTETSVTSSRVNDSVLLQASLIPVVNGNRTAPFRRRTAVVAAVIDLLPGSDWVYCRTANQNRACLAVHQVPLLVFDGDIEFNVSILTGWENFTLLARLVVPDSMMILAESDTVVFSEPFWQGVSVNITVPDIDTTVEHRLDLYLLSELAANVDAFLHVPVPVNITDTPIPDMR